MKEFKIPIIFITMFIGYHLFLTNELDKRLEKEVYQMETILRDGFYQHRFDTIDTKLDDIFFSIVNEK